jgi:hypothetical protein
MNSRPSRAVLPAFQYGEVEISVSLMDLLKTVIISAITAVVNLPVFILQYKRCPQRIIGIDDLSSGEMLRRRISLFSPFLFAYRGVSALPHHLPFLFYHRPPTQSIGQMERM